MDYALVKNQANQLMKGFKGHIYGFMVIAVIVQMVINSIVAFIAPDSVFLVAIVGIVAQAIIVPSIIGLVQCVVKAKVKGTYRYVMPGFWEFLSSLGILITNGIASQVIVMMMLIPVLIFGMLSMMILPTGAILILGMLMFVVIVMVTTFIYMQALLGICEIVNNGSFKNAVISSWGYLFNNFKFFFRASLIMLPIIILTVVILIGGIGAVVFSTLLGSTMSLMPIVILGVVMLGGIAVMVLGVVLTPKLFTVCYIGYSAIVAMDKKRVEELNL